MSASNTPLTLALVAALASSLTVNFVGYAIYHNDKSHGRKLRRWNASNGASQRPRPVLLSGHSYEPLPRPVPRPVTQPVPVTNRPGAGYRARDVGDYFFADELCQDFCTQFFRDCQNHNPYTNPSEWVWEYEYNPNYNRRRLSADSEIKRFREPRAHDSGNLGNVRAKNSKEREQGRKDRLLAYDEEYADCLNICMGWPRPMDPANYTGTAPRESTGGGDHFWCRRWHLNQVVDLNNAAFHCPHATDSSLGICRDAHIDGFSAYEWLQQEADSNPQHRHPFCDVAGKVVDCTMGGITDENFHDVLQSLPGNMEILFLHGNSITKIDGPIAQHLNEPTKLKALYMNDNGLKTVSADAFKGLDNLEAWNADVNEVATLDEDFLQYTPKLRHFSMHTNSDLFAPSIPAGFFRHTPKLEVMFAYGTGVSTFLPGTFDGLTSLTMTSFVTNGKITEESFPNPPELFKDLTSLLYFDFFANPIKSIPENFFGPWASNLVRITFWNCPITSIHKNAGLEHLKNIKQAYFHYYEDGPGDFRGVAGGSFDYGPVLRKLIKINPDVDMTYGTVAAPTPSLRKE